jgi:transposase
VDVRGPIPRARPRGCPSTRVRSWRGLERAEVGRTHRLSVAIHAPRPASVGSRLPTNAAMAQGGSVRGDDPRSLRVLVRLSKERTSEPTAAIVDSRTLRSTPESGSRGGYDGHKNKKGSKVHAAVDTLGHLLALRVSPANEDDRKEVEKLSEEIQKATGENVELAYVDQGYTGEKASESAAEHGIRLEVVKHEAAKGGFVLLPRRWVVERDFAWASRFRRLVKDYERLPETLAGLHFVAFACLFLQQAAGMLLIGS